MNTAKSDEMTMLDRDYVMVPPSTGGGRCEAPSVRIYIEDIRTDPDPSFPSWARLRVLSWEAEPIGEMYELDYARYLGEAHRIARDAYPGWRRTHSESVDA